MTGAIADRRPVRHRGNELHPMQQAWLDYDVGRCGYCQPGQIVAAVALVKQVTAAPSPEG